MHSIRLRCRTKLADRQLPTYSVGEEIFNCVSHIVGAVFGVFILVSCYSKAYTSHNARIIAAALIYGISTLFLYTISGVYHGSVVKPLKKVLQVVDHCGVFLMIAGSYTPVMLCGVYRTRPVLATVMLIIVYCLTAAGIVLNCIDLKIYHEITLAMQIIMGWSVVASLYYLYKSVGLKDVLFIIIGGLLYSVGAILYHKGAKKKYYHSVFHIFVLAGSLFHYLGIIDMF